MTYLRNTLAGLAAVLVGMLGPTLVTVFRGINSSKATGLAAVLGGLLESLLSPWCWLLALSFFGLFYAFSRLKSKALRIVLFWVPVSSVSTLGICILALFTYLWMEFPRG